MRKCPGVKVQDSFLGSCLPMFRLVLKYTLNPLILRHLYDINIQALLWLSFLTWKIGVLPLDCITSIVIPQKFSGVILPFSNPNSTTLRTQG